MEQLKKLPPQYKLLIGIGFLGFVAGAFYYLVIMELDAKIHQTRGGLLTTQKELDTFKDFRGEIEIAELREQYAQVIKRIEENKKIIPDKEMLPQLMSGLESDAMEAGLVVVSKEQKSRVAEDFYIRTPILFEITGSYLNLVRFLKLISQPGKRLVNVGSVDIKVLKTKRSQRQKKDASPFTDSGRVAAAESEISATFVVEGFTYTGGDSGGGGKADKKKKKK
jgi:Tfp pilus assembly protein PilO